MTKPSVATLPLFNSRKDHPSTGELIFKILSGQYPLTILALQKQLAQKYRLKISYQAVRKSLGVLIKAGAVEHVKEGFQISTHWLLSVRGVIDDTLRNYCYGKGKALDETLRSQTFSGQSLYEVDTLWGEIVVSLCASQGQLSRKRFISINHFPWWVPINVGHEVEFCRRLKEIGFEVIYLFSQRCPSTEWASRFYKSFDVKTIINTKIPLEHRFYYNVIGDSVIEVEISTQHEQTIRSLFGGRRRAEQIEAKDLVALSHQHGEIRITVQNNKTFAEGLLRTVKLL